MVPKDDKTRRDLFLRWSNGNESAADLLQIVSDMARAADDAVDQDHGPVIEKVGDFWRGAFVDLPANRFFAENHACLVAAINEAFVYYALSEEWKRGDEKQQMFAFVHREATDRILIAIAARCGGLDHAKNCMRELYELGHRHGESFQDWKETI